MGPKTDARGREYGRRLIPQVIDDIANTDPLREAFQFPRTDNPKDGWRSMTFKEYANAINRCARMINETCGEATEGSFPTIAYIGPQDARYVVMIFAAVKIGYRALYISPRNSEQGQLNLFEKTDCHVLAYASSSHMMVQPWLEKRTMKAFEVKSFEEWFSPDEVPPVPFGKTFEQAEWEPLCVLHTSGSTGLPKPVVATHGMLAISDAIHHQPDWHGYTHWVPAWAQRSKRIFMPMPLFHSGALYGFIFFAIYWDTPVAFGIPDMMLSSDLAMDCLDNLDVEATVLPPSILEEMCTSEKCIRTLKNLKVVAYGGGNLATEAGDTLVKSGVPLQTTMNTTEFSPFPVYFQPKADLWNYFIFNSDLLGCEWREAHDSTYECVVVRKSPDHPGLQGFFYTFPDLREYPTKDLYRPHPSLPDHWTYYGRADNVIVFSNGEKLNPVTIEDAIQSHPRIKGALVVGSNRFQAGLFLEPSTSIQDDTDKEELIESIWPLVERANNETVGHGRIGRTYIAVAGQPFLRAGKGTVQRALTVDLLSDEIDRLYDNAERLLPAVLPPLDVSSVESLAASIKKILESERSDLQLEPDTNIFTVGVDSRQTINTARLLRASLEAAGHASGPESLGPRAIYNNPTCRRLAQYISITLLQSENGHDSERYQEEHEIEVMKTLHARYTQDLTRGKPGRTNISSNRQTVILTGSTGMLGSHLLAGLARDPTVERIVCLNRAKDGGAAQQSRSMAQRGLPAVYKAKAEFHCADASLPSLGLDSATYTDLLQKADRVIHCAWPVNFNFSTETFEPQVRGARHIADLAASARKRVAVVFISSVSTAANWDPLRGPVPEERLADWSLPAPSGYGRSKMVASMVLDAAAAAGVGDFPVSTIRLGQIAGPEETGGVGSGAAWSTSDWLPSIVASGLHLGALPVDLGTADRVDWLPVERAAALVLDVALAPPEEVGGYFHGVNAAAVSWRELAPAVLEFYGGRVRDLVSFDEWVTRLEGSRRGQDGLADDANPGLKLLDTYRGMMWRGEGRQPVVFGTGRAGHISPSARGSTAVSQDLMRRWCSQWGF